MRKILFEVNHFCICLLRAVFSIIENGNTCIICNKNSLLVPLCKECQKKYFNISLALSVNRCEICGKELTSNITHCSACRDNPVLQSTNKVIPLFSYRLWNKELLYLWKIKQQRGLSSVFADFVHQALKILDIKIIVPVPPRKGKIAREGWDQIEELCKFLEYRYGYKILRLLERESTKQQKKLNREERLNTIKSGYSLRQTTEILPDSVVLLDDVCTTGSTIECCAALLKKSGIKNVNAVTLFTVD